jgi:hypothetical protein
MDHIHEDDIRALRRQGDLRGYLRSLARHTTTPASAQPAATTDYGPHHTPGAWPYGTHPHHLDHLPPRLRMRPPTTHHLNGPAMATYRAGICPHPDCNRAFALTANGLIRRHTHGPAGTRRTAPICPGSGQKPAPHTDQTDQKPPDRRADAAILRWAAVRLRDDHSEYAAADQLDTWADQIHPA